MEVILSRKGELTVLNLSGPMTGLRDALRLKSILNGLFEKREHWVSLELSQLENLDSTALHVLIFAKERAEKSGGRLFLDKPSPEVAEMLRVTGMAGLFPAPDKTQTPTLP